MASLVPYVKKAISNGIDVTVVDDMSTMNTDNLGREVNLIREKVENFKTMKNLILFFILQPDPLLKIILNILLKRSFQTPLVP
jgi:hypothetical protein